MDTEEIPMITTTAEEEVPTITTTSTDNSSTSTTSTVNPLIDDGEEEHNDIYKALEEDEIDEELEEKKRNYKKHPLNREWRIFYDSKPIPRKKAKSVMNESEFTEKVTLLTSFATVEDFWCLNNHIPDPSDLNTNSTLYIAPAEIFADEKGVPTWEMFPEGGQWVFSCPMGGKRFEINRIWCDGALAVIGEVFGDHSGHIKVLELKISPKFFKIAFWLDTKDKAKIVAIGKLIRAILAIPVSVNIIYNTFNSLITTKNSTPLFTLSGDDKKLDIEGHADVPAPAEAPKEQEQEQEKK